MEPNRHRCLKPLLSRFFAALAYWGVRVADSNSLVTFMWLFTGLVMTLQKVQSLIHHQIQALINCLVQTLIHHLVQALTPHLVQWFLHVNLEDCLKRIVHSLPSFILTAVSQDTLEINNLISIINSIEAENTSLKQFTDTDLPQLTISRPNQFDLSTIERTILWSPTKKWCSSFLPTTLYHLIAQRCPWSAIIDS